MESTMTPLQRVTERVNRHGDVNDQETPRPLLTAEEFFEGNDVAGSIGCNLLPVPSPHQFYEVLKGISAKSEVADVRVQVSMFDDPEWPFSDRVWVITSASPEDVAIWFPESLRPDECVAGWDEGTTCESCAVPQGMRPIACLWD